MLLSRFLAFRRCEAGGSGSSGCHRNECLVEFHLTEHPVGIELLVGLVWSTCGATSVLTVERQTPVPCLLVFYGRGEAVAFLGVYVYDGGSVGVLHAAEHIDEFFNVVAFFKICVFESPCLEPVVAAGAVALP